MFGKFNSSRRWGLAALVMLSGCTSSQQIDSVIPANTDGADAKGESVTWTVPPKIAPKVASNPVQASLPQGHPHVPQAAPPGPRKIDILLPREALLKDEIATLGGLFNKIELDEETQGLLAKEGVPPLDGPMVQIFLDRTSVRSEMLLSMQGLETAHYVSLYRTQVDDEGLRALANCKKLVFVDLSYTRVTDAGLEYLKGLPNLTRVVVSDTRVTADGMAALQGALNNAVVSRNYDPRK